MSNKALKKIVIVGGGSAGWMTATALSKAVKGGCEIELIESEQIGTVGVGEATIPPIREFNALLDIDEAEFMRRTLGAYKLGILFENWTRIGHDYMHPFGRFGVQFDKVSFYHYWLKSRANGNEKPLDHYSLGRRASDFNKFAHPMTGQDNIASTFDYAFHFDASLYAKYLREISEANGVKRTEGKISDVEQDGETGEVTGVVMEDGRRIEGEFFVDCSGFRGLLIEGALETGYEDWTHWLPCDRAVAMICRHGDAFRPYTTATAHRAGWQWRIPLQHRNGNGHVFSSAHMNEDEAADILKNNLDGEPVGEPWLLKFTTGRRKKCWNKNVVAIGLAGGFLEPLESTSLHLTQSAIMKLLNFFPTRNMPQIAIDTFNARMAQEYEEIRDFLILHYNATERNDSEFWNHCRTMDVPQSLQDRMTLFREAGRLAIPQSELFTEPSWLAVLAGQNVLPDSYDTLVDMRGVDGEEALRQIDRAIAECADSMPSQRSFIDQFCRADDPEARPGSQAAQPNPSSQYFGYSWKANSF